MSSHKYFSGDSRVAGAIGILKFSSRGRINHCNYGDAKKDAISELWEYEEGHKLWMDSSYMNGLGYDGPTTHPPLYSPLRLESLCEARVLGLISDGRNWSIRGWDGNASHYKENPIVKGVDRLDSFCRGVWHAEHIYTTHAWDLDTDYIPTVERQHRFQYSYLPFGRIIPSELDEYYFIVTCHRSNSQSVRVSGGDDFDNDLGSGIKAIIEDWLNELSLYWMRAADPKKQAQVRNIVTLKYCYNFSRQGTVFIFRYKAYNFYVHKHAIFRPQKVVVHVGEIRWEMGGGEGRHPRGEDQLFFYHREVAFEDTKSGKEGGEFGDFVKHMRQAERRWWRNSQAFEEWQERLEEKDYIFKTKTRIVFGRPWFKKAKFNPTDLPRADCTYYDQESGTRGLAKVHLIIDEPDQDVVMSFNNAAPHFYEPGATNANLFSFEILPHSRSNSPWSTTDDEVAGILSDGDTSNSSSPSPSVAASPASSGHFDDDDSD